MKFHKCNTLWDRLSAKHSDKADLKDPDANWGVEKKLRIF